MKELYVFVISLAAVSLMALVLAAPVRADRVTAPGEIILLSDEIFGNSVDVTRPSYDGDSDSGDSDSDSDSGDSR